MSAPHRTGLSLVELLATVGLTFMLVGLVLSAVQKARATADRLACQDRMRQLAVALHHVHGTTGTLPRGHVPAGSAARRVIMPFTGWHLQITPHVEQQTAWEVGQTDLAADPTGLAVVHRGDQLLVPAFQCPSDPRVRVIQREQLVPRVSAYTSYFGVSGTNLLRRDGVLFLDSSVRLEHVTDGTSQTLLLGERPPTDLFPYGQWYSAYGQRDDGSASRVLGVREVVVFTFVGPCTFGPYRFGPGRTENPCDNFHYWSLHPGGANFAFCDGSVRFLRYEADAVLPALATRGGGEAAAVPD